MSIYNAVHSTNTIPYTYTLFHIYIHFSAVIFICWQLKYSPSERQKRRKNNLKSREWKKWSDFNLWGEKMWTLSFSIPPSFALALALSLSRFAFTTFVVWWFYVYVMMLCIFCKLMRKDKSRGFWLVCVRANYILWHVISHIPMHVKAIKKSIHSIYRA